MQEEHDQLLSSLTTAPRVSYERFNALLREEIARYSSDDTPSFSLDEQRQRVKTFSQTFAALISEESLSHYWKDLIHDSSVDLSVALRRLTSVYRCHCNLVSLTTHAHHHTTQSHNDAELVPIGYEAFLARVVCACCVVLENTHTNTTDNTDTHTETDRESLARRLPSLFLSWDSLAQRNLVIYILTQAKTDGSVFILPSHTQWCAQLLSLLCKVSLKLTSSQNNHAHTHSPKHAHAHSLTHTVRTRGTAFLSQLILTLQGSFFDAFHSVAVSQPQPDWLPEIIAGKLPENERQRLLAYVAGVWSTRQFLAHSPHSLLVSVTSLIVSLVDSLSRPLLQAPSQYGLSCEALLAVGVSTSIEQSLTRRAGLLVMRALCAKFDRAFNEELLRDAHEQEQREEVKEQFREREERNQVPQEDAFSDDSDSEIEGYPIPEEFPLDEFDKKKGRDTNTNYIFVCLELLRHPMDKPESMSKHVKALEKLASLLRDGPPAGCDDYAIPILQQLIYLSENYGDKHITTLIDSVATMLLVFNPSANIEPISAALTSPNFSILTKLACIEWMVHAAKRLSGIAVNVVEEDALLSQAAAALLIDAEGEQGDGDIKRTTVEQINSKTIVKRPAKLKQLQSRHRQLHYRNLFVNIRPIFVAPLIKIISTGRSQHIGEKQKETDLGRRLENILRRDVLQEEQTDDTSREDGEKCGSAVDHLLLVGVLTALREFVRLEPNNEFSIQIIHVAYAFKEHAFVDVRRAMLATMLVCFETLLLRNKRPKNRAAPSGVLNSLLHIGRDMEDEWNEDNEEDPTNEAAEIVFGNAELVSIIDSLVQQFQQEPDEISRTLQRSMVDLIVK